MKSIEKTGKDLLFIGCVFFSLWFYLQGFIKEFPSENLKERDDRRILPLKEDSPSGFQKCLPEEKTEEPIVAKEAPKPPNREAERILSLIREGKLSDRRASFYRKLPSLNDKQKEQERTK